MLLLLATLPNSAWGEYPKEDDYTKQVQIIQDAFNSLRSIGEASNAGHGRVEIARQACLTLKSQSSAVLNKALDNLFYKNISVSPEFNSVILSKGASGLLNALNNGCSSLAEQGSYGSEDLKADAINLALDGGEDLLKDVARPFVKNIELEAGYKNGEFSWQTLGIVPIWHDEQNKNHLFTQLSWQHGTEDGDTFNAGLSIRRVNSSNTIVYGVNSFFDYIRRTKGTRMSVGVDVQSELLGLSINHYFPLSEEWKDISDTERVRVAKGWDMEFQGRLHDFPSLQANIRGYRWASNDGGEPNNVLGYDASLEWTPVNILTIEAGARNEQKANPSFYTSMRLNYNFGSPIEEYLSSPAELGGVDNLIYSKVQRENHVRTSSIKEAEAAVDTGPVLNFMGQTLSNLTSSSYTFSGQAIGSASPDRLVIVAVTTAGPAGDSDVTGITIGGNPATIHAQGWNGGGNHYQVATIASLLVPVGANADIVVNTSGTTWSCSLMVYTATNLNSTTPTGTAESTISGLTQKTLSVPVLDGGFIIGAAHVYGSSNSIYTENNALDVVDASGLDRYTVYYSAHSTNLVANPAYPVTFRNSDDSIWFGAAMVSWR